MPVRGCERGSAGGMAASSAVKRSRSPVSRATWVSAVDASSSARRRATRADSTAAMAASATRIACSFAVSASFARACASVSCVASASERATSSARRAPGLVVAPGPRRPRTVIIPRASATSPASVTAAHPSGRRDQPARSDSMPGATTVRCSNSGSRRGLEQLGQGLAPSHGFQSGGATGWCPVRGTQELRLPGSPIHGQCRRRAPHERLVQITENGGHGSGGVRRDRTQFVSQAIPTGGSKMIGQVGIPASARDRPWPAPRRSVGPAPRSR